VVTAEMRKTAAPARRFELESASARLTPAERAERGKVARRQVPRENHAVFDPGSRRPYPLSLLEQQAVSRVPELVPVRYGRMAVSAFSYYRGAALPMAHDLATTPVSGLAVQVCGDAHLSNFGLFASPERKLVFDINDFDETLPGPWEWDIKRLAASLEVAGRENGFPAKDRLKIVLATVAHYRQVMRTAAGMTNLGVWYTQIDIETLKDQLRTQLQDRQRRAIDEGMAKARTRDSMQAVSKLTRVADGRPRIVADPPLIVPLADLLTGQPEADLETQLRGLIRKYRRTLQSDRRTLLDQFRFADIARKVVGVGSVGTRCWIILMLGRDESDALLLQVKEAEQSVLSVFTGPGRHINQGQRVVAGQRLMQAASDIFLGWDRIENGLDGKSHDYYVRQLRDWKFSLDPGSMIPRGMRMYGELCGASLARAHARSGDRIAIASYLGRSDAFDRAIAEFAAAYADQNERDYQALLDAITSGQVTAVPDL
jgi:uncharacterized protein (DUF2252 family)